MSEVRIDCARMDSRESMHDELAGAFKLPKGYGRNLDALADCLSERPGTHVVLDNEAALAGLGAYGRKLLQVLDDASRSVPGFTLESLEEEQ